MGDRVTCERDDLPGRCPTPPPAAAAAAATGLLTTGDGVTWESDDLADLCPATPPPTPAAATGLLPSSEELDSRCCLVSMSPTDPAAAAAVDPATAVRVGTGEDDGRVAS
jgi:hypothetical protein